MNPIKRITDIEEILSKKIEKGKFPSVQYYLFNEDNILKSVQLGFANIGQKQQVDINTTYNASSVTKTFTALAVLQLAEQGKVDINKPVLHYLPDFPYGTEITVKQLLSHSAGIPNPISVAWIHFESEQEIFNRKQFFKTVFEANKKIKSKPNQKYAYSNLGYLILGQLIEKMTGKSYEESITESIIQKLPLSPDDLTFTITDSPTHAVGYQHRYSFSNLIVGLFINRSHFMEKPEGKWRPFCNFYLNGAPYGGLIGKPMAFVKYIQELLKEESNLISVDYKQLLFQENKTNSNKNTGMCLSWFKGKLNGVEYFAHAGGGCGYYCEIRIYPDIKKGSVVFFNRTGMLDKRYLDKLDRFYISTGKY